MIIQLIGVYLLGVITTYIMIGLAFARNRKQLMVASCEVRDLLKKYNTAIEINASYVEENTKIRARLQTTLEDNIKVLRVIEDKLNSRDIYITEEDLKGINK